MSELNKCAGPPGGPKDLWVHRLDENESIEVACLGERVEGYMSHWQPLPGKTKGYSVACTKPLSECVGHQRGLSQRWRGVMHAFEFNRGRQLYLEIPPETQTKLQVIVGPDLSFRGLVFLFRRMNGKQTRVGVELKPDYGSRSRRELPPFKSADETMQKMWRINQDRYGNTQENA